MNRSIFASGRIAALIVVGTAILAAQGTQTSSITGRVISGPNAGIAGATIRMTSPSMQGVRTTVTDDQGKFAQRLLPPGLYTIEVIKAGFITLKTTEKIGIDQNYQPTFTMGKTAGATVEVVATASAAVDKSDVKTATNYSLDAVDTLPVANRTMETVALLTPGVTLGVGGRVQIRGAMTSGNLMLLDGQNMEDNAYANRGVTVIDDAIEETQIITGAISAEYGNVEGGVMNSITRSGSNTFTGQIRWELANPAWNASMPLQNRTSLGNALGDQRTFSLGGFIIKDKLWFFASYYSTNSTGVGTLSSSSNSPETGQSFPTTLAEIRRQIKLTYQINQNHTIVASWMNQQNAQGNRLYSGGDFASLLPQKNESGLWNISWRAVWSPTATSELRFGAKRQVLTAGGLGTTVAQSPIYEDATGLRYNMGIFNSNDGGDHRENRTINYKVSLFLEGAGSHQVDLGVDYYKGIRHAANGQTPTGYIFEANRVFTGTQTAEIYMDPTGTPGASIWTYQLGKGEADSFTYGLYANDKWSLNKNLSFQLGLRLDKYQSKNETDVKTAGAQGLSPRLGLKYDILGDSKWVAGLSLARYNGKVLEGILDKVTSQGNPTETDYQYNGPTNGAAPKTYFTVPFSTLLNLANYNMTPAGAVYYNNPAVNVKLAPGLKAPHVDEIQGSLAYSFSETVVGSGFVRATAAYKEWKDIIDYSVGNNGTVLDALGQSHYMIVWNNNPDAKRRYHDLELDAQDTLGKWTVAGNITWSSLRGNYEGEGSSTPARGEGINAWNVVNGVTMFNNSNTAPYGYLQGHVATRMRWTASYSDVNSIGAYNVGLIYRFDTGQHYSATRTVSRGGVNPAIPSEAGSTFTEYKDMARGAGGILPTVALLDLAVTQNFALAKINGTAVNAFAKIVFQNVLNHQQLNLWPYTYANGANFNSAWVPSANYGTTGAGNYAMARTITASAGIKF